MPPLPPSSDLRRLDPRIWRACAGSSVHIPTVNSRVYYFPQGHLEQYSSSASNNVSALARSIPFIPCHISAVQFLADPVTDEVYTKLHLYPIDPPLNQSLSMMESSARPEREGADDDEDKIVAFAKILTPSDANNGGGFSVPRFCADSIFPPLNYQAEPPVQTLTVTDIHGVTWDFRHIYRGTPRRHLLTTGWSKFVNHKKLIAGDSVVFMRNLAGEMFIGVRRAVRSNNGSDCARWREQIGCGTGDVKIKVKDEGFSRSGRGRVSQEAVMEAVERATQGLPFEVVYYPRAGWYSDFVVKATLVERALNVFWTAGMRVKMAMETEDSSRMTWFQGTISSASVPECGPWRFSPWRMLQITWDEPEVLQIAKRVSPWQVEILAPAPPIHAAFPPAKRFKFPENSGLQTDGKGELFFPMSGLSNSTIGNVNQSLLNYNIFPAGMQGARHAHCGLPLSDLHLSKLQTGLLPAGFPPLLDHVATHTRTSNSPMIQKPSMSENVSCVLTMSHSTQTSKKTNDTKTPKLVLFGQPILTEQQISLSCSGGDTLSPVHTGNSSSEGNLDKMANFSDGSGSAALHQQSLPETGHCKVFMESEDVGRTLDLSLLRSYEELYRKLADMFSIENSETLNNVLYRDVTGAVKHIGGEPFSDFMKTARRLTVLMDSSSDNVGL